MAEVELEVLNFFLTERALFLFFLLQFHFFRLHFIAMYYITEHMVRSQFKIGILAFFDRSL